MEQSYAQSEEKSDQLHKMTSTLLTQEDLTIMTMTQLKFALQAEMDEKTEAQEVIQHLQQENVELNEILNQRDFDLEIESTCLQLTVQASCNPSSPSLLVRALIQLLPQHLADTLNLTCFIRAGESWTIISSNNSDNHTSIRTAALDEAARVVKPEVPVPLLSLVPRETAKRIFYKGSGLFGEETKGGDVDELEGLDSFIEDSMVLTAFSRCLWAITPQSSRSGRAAQLVQEAAEHLIRMRMVVETASQLAMSALVQLLESQQQVRDALVGRSAAALCLHLYCQSPVRPKSVSSEECEANVISEKWRCIPSVLDALIPNSSSEIFLVSPPAASDASMLAITTACDPVIVPAFAHQPSLISLCCSTGQQQVGGTDILGTHLELDCGKDTGVTTSIALPLWACSEDDALLPGYKCVVSVRVRGAKAGAADAVSAVWLSSAKLLRTWMMGPGTLSALLNPIVSMNSSVYVSASSAPPGELLLGLTTDLGRFLVEGTGGDECISSPPSLNIPVASMSNYLGLDWMVAIVMRQDASASSMVLHSPDGTRPYKPEDFQGTLRDLLSSLMVPGDVATAEGGGGLTSLRIESELAVHSSGVVSLLGAKSVHSRLHKLLAFVPPSQCPCFGARLEQHSPSAANLTMLLLGGTVWRPRGIVATDLAPKLRGLGKLFQLGAEIRETGQLYSRVHSVTDKLDVELRGLKVSCEAAAAREAWESQHLNRLRDRVVEIEGAGGGVDAEGEALGGDDGARVRRGVANALQSFVASVYNHESAVGNGRTGNEKGDASFSHVVCQLCLAESVTEEGESRRWLLQPTGEWTALDKSQLQSAAPPSISLSAVADEEGAAAHLMTVRGAHRVVQLYTEGCAERNAEPKRPVSSLEASLSVYAVIGWALVDPSNNTPIMESSSAQHPPLPPSAAIESAWVALLSAALSKNRIRLLGGAISSCVDGWEAGEASVRAVRAGALAGTKLPLQSYLGSRAFLEGLHSRTPGFALIPIRIHGRGDGEEGVWDITSLPPLSSNSQNTPLPAVEQPPRRLPARLGDTVLRAAAGRMPAPGSESSSYSLPEPLPASDVLVVAGGGGTGSSLLALSGMGGCILSHLVGSDSGVGLTLGLDTEEQQGALRSLGITRRSLVLLYLAPASAVFHDEGDEADGTSGQHLAGFICVLRGHRLVAPCSFPLLLKLLDGATLPLRLARAIEPLFLGSGDGEKMLLSCWPDASSEPLEQSDNTSDPAVMRAGEVEWARGLPQRLSASWIACSKRDVVRGIEPRGRCIRAASYVLSGLLPTPVSAAAAFASATEQTSSASAPQAAILPEWRLVLTNCYEMSGQSRSAIIDQEALLAACPVPVPGSGLMQTSSAASGGADGSILVSTGISAPSSGSCSAAGLEVGWEDRALPPSSLATRGPARLLRLFVTVPRSWLRGLPLSSASGNVAGSRVVIASLLFWLEGLAAPVPAGVRLALLKAASHAGGVLGSLLLEAAQQVLTVSALGVRVVSLRQRSRTQAHSLVLLRSLVLSSAQLAVSSSRQDGAGLGAGDSSKHHLNQEFEKLIKVLMDSDAQFSSSTNRHHRALAMQDSITVGAAEVGGGGVDELSAINAMITEDSLVEHEERWLQLTVDAVGEACSLLAMTVDQLREEKYEVAALRKQLAIARVSARRTAQHMREFAGEVAKMLPAASQLQGLEARLLVTTSPTPPPAPQGASPVLPPSGNATSAVDEVQVSQLYMECVCEIVALTARSLRDLLAWNCRMGLREEASQILAAACSPVLHPSLLQGDGQVEWGNRGVVVVWTNELPPSIEMPPLAEVLSSELLRTAWRRGLAVVGPVHLNDLPEMHPNCILSAHGRYMVEYVPYPRAEAGQTLLEDDSQNAAHLEGYPRFIVQYLVSSNGNSHISDDISDASNWGTRMSMVRSWLNDVLWDLPAPPRPSASHNVLALASTVSAEYDSSAALLLLLHSVNEPLDVAAHSIVSAPSWAAFTLSATLYLSALLRVDACLLCPDVQSADTTSTAVTQMWGTVCRFASGMSRADQGPIVLAAGQVDGLLRRTNTLQDMVRCLDGDRTPSSIGGPVLLDGVFGGASVGAGKCVMALPFSAEGTGEGSPRVCWLAVVQAPRRLGSEESELLLSTCRLISALACSRLESATVAGMSASLRQATWLRDVLGHTLEVSRAIKSSSGTVTSTSENAAAVEEQRLCRVVAQAVPSLPLLQVSSAVLLPVMRSAVLRATQWIRGSETVTPGDDARCLSTWSILCTAEAAFVPVALFGDDGNKGEDLGESAQEHNCWAMRISFFEGSETLRLLSQFGSVSDGIDADQHTRASTLHHGLLGVAEDIRRSLMLTRLARSRAARDFAKEIAHGAGTVGRAMAALHTHSAGSIAALGLVLALCLAPRDAPERAIRGARLHWQNMRTVRPLTDQTSPPASPSSWAQHAVRTGHWLTCDVLLESGEEDSQSAIQAEQAQATISGGLEEEEVHRMLRLGRWSVRESSAPLQTLDRVVSTHALSSHALVTDDPPAASGAQETQPSSLACQRIWLDASAGGQTAVLELRVTSKLLADLWDHSSLMVLQCGIAQAVGSIATNNFEHTNTLTAERALFMARQQSLVLAACLGELCTEGRPPEGYSGPSCGYIGVMLQRIQGELNRMPGVRGTRIQCRDTVEALELYAAFSTAPGQPPLLGNQSVGSPSGLARTVSVTVGMASSPAISRGGPAHGASLGSPTYTFSPTAGGFEREDAATSGADQGSEFSFSCGEISGALTVYFVTAERADDDEGGLQIGAHASGHCDSNGLVFVALGRALARRVFELHRGHRNQQLMLKQQKSTLNIKTELAARHELALELESAKSVALTQLQQAQEDNETLRSQIRQEKSAAAEAIAAHKALSKQLQRVSSDLKTESGKELQEMKAEAHRKEAVASAELARREAIITVLREDKKAAERSKKDLAVALEREKVLEKGRYELALSCSELEAMTVSQRAELKELQGALSDCRRQISLLEADKKGSADLVALYQTEKQRGDRLQQFLDMLKA